MTSEEVEAEVRALVVYWQQELRLQDWDITVEVPAHDIGAFAEVDYSLVYAKVTMQIRNPSIAPPRSKANNDLEETVVHELLHMRFKLVHPVEGTPDYYEFEQGIERIAQALVRARRASKVSGIRKLRSI